MSRVKEELAPQDYETTDLVLAGLRSARFVVNSLWANHKLDDEDRKVLMDALQSIHHDYSCGAAGDAR